MNYDNNSQNYMQNSVFPPTPPEADGLSFPAAAILTLLATAFMAIGGIWNIRSVTEAGDAASALAGAGIITFVFMIFACGITAFVTYQRPVFVPAVPLLSLAAVIGVLYVAGDSLTPTLFCNALFTVLPLPGAIVLAITEKFKLHRTSAIIVSAAATGVFALILIFTKMYVLTGSISVSALVDDVNTMRDALIVSLKERAGAIAEIYKVNVSEIDIDGTVNEFFNLLPSFAVTGCAVVAFFAQKIMFSLFRMYRLARFLTPDMTVFALSKITAVIFFSAYIASLFFTSSSSVATAVLDNLYCILEPGLAVAGLISLLPKRTGSTVRVGCFPMFALVFLFVFSPSLAFLLLAVIGALTTLNIPEMFKRGDR